MTPHILKNKHNILQEPAASILRVETMKMEAEAYAETSAHMEMH
jgi:hypothetical protein